jgi:hypothetical protein
VISPFFSRPSPKRTAAFNNSTHMLRAYLRFEGLARAGPFLCVPSMNDSFEARVRCGPPAANPIGALVRVAARFSLGDTPVSTASRRPKAQSQACSFSVGGDEAAAYAASFAVPTTAAVIVMRKLRQRG